jgi:hypothetical protein
LGAAPGTVKFIEKKAESWQLVAGRREEWKFSSMSIELQFCKRRRVLESACIAM